MGSASCPAAGLLNYNVVEGILLFTVALVCLLGVLLEVARPTDDFYQSSRTTLTYKCVAALHHGLLMHPPASAASCTIPCSDRACVPSPCSLLLLLAAGITYFTVVFFADLASQFITKRETNAFATGGGSNRKLDKKAKLAAQDKRTTSGVNILKGASSTEIATSNNPMLLMSASRQGSDNFIRTITSMEEAPSKAAWAVFKDQLQTVTAQLQEMSTEMSSLKSENARLQQRLDTAEPSPAVVRSPRLRHETQQRRQFEPRAAVATAEGPGSPSLSGTFAPFKRTLSTKRMSVSRMPIARVSSDGGDSDGDGGDIGSPKSVTSPLALARKGSYASPLSLSALKAADSRSASARSMRRSKIATDAGSVLADDDDGTPPLSTDVSEMTSFQLDGTPMATAAPAPADGADAPAPATTSE